MNDTLPTSGDLEKLPLRAVVAYAAGTARRVSADFRGIVADDVLDNVLRLIDHVLVRETIGELDGASIVSAAQRVVAAYNTAPSRAQSGERDHLLFSFVQAALAATSAIAAARDPVNARHHLRRAAREAEQAVDPIKSLSGSAGMSAMIAAQRDYDMLRGLYGEHDDVILGDPLEPLKDK